tara:strand:- start:280 stop:1062 length:783 start_codon:yes stop_codon:yes gene_type:complete
MNTKIKVFTQEGMHEFRNLLNNMAKDAPYNSPMLYSDFWEKYSDRWDNLIDRQKSFTKAWTHPIDISNDISLKTKRDISAYLHEIFQPALGETPSDILGNEGLWSWLSGFFLKTLAAKDESFINVQVNKEVANYLYDSKGKNSVGFSNGSLNILQSSFRLYSNFEGKVGNVLLKTPVFNLGDQCSHVFQQMGFIQSQTILEVLDFMFPTGNIQDIRRFVVILNQLRRNYDIFNMSSEQLLSLLANRNDYKEQLHMYKIAN